MLNVCIDKEYGITRSSTTADGPHDALSVEILSNAACSTAVRKITFERVALTINNNVLLGIAAQCWIAHETLKH